MVSYHQEQYNKKTNDPILRKLSDRWRDRSSECTLPGFCRCFTDILRINLWVLFLGIRYFELI